MPMAGLGTRFAKVAFQNSEYKKPKPFINVRGLPMVRWATGSLPFVEHPGQTVSGSLRITPKDIIFIILKQHNDEYGIEGGLKEIYSDKIRIIVLPAVTRGAAETAYRAKPFLDEEEDVIFCDSDHYFDGSTLQRTIIEKPSDIAGIIPVFPPPDPHQSFSLLRAGTNEIIQVGEKDPEMMKKGAPANIGAYYFTKAKYFLQEAEEVMEENELSGPSGKGEFYIAPLYQRLFNKGMRLLVAPTKESGAWERRQDLELFLKNCPVQKP